MSSPRVGFGRDVVGTFATRVVVLGLGVASSVVLARALGAEGRGLVAALLVYPTLLFSLFEGGFRQAAVFAIGRRAWPENAVVGAVLSHFLVASTVSMAVVASLLTWISPSDWLGLWIVLAAAQVPVRLANALVRGLLLGRQAVGTANAIERRSRFGYSLVLVLLFAVDGLTVTTALAAGVVGHLAGLGLAWRRLQGLEMAAPRWVASVWRAMLKRGTVFAVGLFVLQLNYRLDVILLERLSDTATIGRYAVATQLAELLWQLPAAFGLVIFSRAAASEAAGDRAMVDQVAQATRVSLALVAAAAIAAAVLAPVAVPRVFGSAFGESVPMLWALLPGVVALTTFKVINAFVAGGGAPRIAIGVMLPAVILNVVLNVWWIPMAGGVGAAFASSVSYLLAGAAFVVYFAITHRLPWTRLVFVNRDDLGQLVKRTRRSRAVRSGKASGGPLVIKQQDGDR